MALELKATVIQIHKEITGQGQKGTWRKKEHIVETKSQYPKKICLSVWGDKIDSLGLIEGGEYTFSLDIESREYNGRWYTDVKAYEAKQEGSAPKESKTAQKKDAVPDFDDNTALPF
jgi:hypothetical protein